MKAQICPVCSGEGTIKDNQDWNTSPANCWRKTCHGCGGKGWVEVGEIFERSSKKFLKDDANEDKEIAKAMSDFNYSMFKD